MDYDNDCLQGRFSEFMALTGAAKEEVYSWKKIDNSQKGRFLQIPKRILHIDANYQRDDISRCKILDIAKNFNWRDFGCLDVAMRSDSSYGVTDGGTRTRAALLRTEINELPCFVFNFDDAKEEAKTFLGINTNRKPVTAIVKHKALSFSENQLALNVDRIINKSGYEISSAGNGEYKFKSVGSLEKMIKENAELGEQVFLFLASMCAGKRINDFLLSGLFCLSKRILEKYNINIITDSGYSKKLRITGAEVIETQIRKRRIVDGAGGEVVCGKAILDVLNKGKKTKLEW